MDTLNWIHDIAQGPLNEVLESIYQEYFINRTFVIYSNLKTCIQEVSELNVPFTLIHSIYDLNGIHQSPYRIVLIPFHLIYEYRKTIASYLIQDHYLMMLQDLSSLQEQCCWDLFETDKNFYMFVN